MSFVRQLRDKRCCASALLAVRAAAIGVVLSSLAAGTAESNTSVASPDRPVLQGVGSRSDNLEVFRQVGDSLSQRRHVWGIIAELTKTVPGNDQPLFESWYGEEEVFATGPSDQVARGIRGFSRASASNRMNASNGDDFSLPADAALLTYTLYNKAAHDHIHRHHLNTLAELERLRNAGSPDVATAGNRSVPTFPSAAIVLKTVWWPVARDTVTALPVWDPESNPPRRGGINYTNWQRVVGVVPFRSTRPIQISPHIDFAGRSFPDAHLVALDKFYYIVVQPRLAERLALDAGAQKAAAIALGRELKSGDYLLLVGANLATREISDWVWATFWWHDRPDQGPFAADRPRSVKSQWRNYLMQAAFDSDRPVAFDGGPFICFNPWLEGRFPDGGHGGGTVSNCMACHRRASYPPIKFLPVTRGAPDLTDDPAYAPGRLRTSFLWSIALHARR